MATGFGSTTVTQSSGYQTIFQRIKEKAGNQERSLGWYRNAIHEETLSVPKILQQERLDTLGADKYEDQNVLRRYVLPGHVYLFSYKAKMKYLEYYDRSPLVYVIKTIGRTEFFGANLHYIKPKRRFQPISKLQSGMVDIPKRCFHKYIRSHVDGLFLDLASSEWNTAILLPVDDFVKEINGMLYPVDKKDVWDDTDEQYYDRVKARHLVKNYGS